MLPRIRAFIRHCLAPGVVAGLLALFCMQIATSPARAATPPPALPDTPIDSLREVESAIVRIEAVGTFVDPDEGAYQNTPGFGSGFIVDPSGIAVTNNHVVTGGALFRVYVPGRTRPVNAKVLGVSECSDLAVIDLQGDGYPYLAWEDARLQRGQVVYAAGYPMGETDFVLTNGEVIERDAEGESRWSSLDAVIAHDARIRPGSSGGPLLNERGQVVGVNYARDSFMRESYAIAAADARPLAEVLAAGENVDTLGINGLALDEEGRTGVWVASVASGSAADRTGVLPGDLILTLENVTVGSDGTLRDYCDVIASHRLQDVLAVEVYRARDDVVLGGQINGRALAALEIDPAEALQGPPDLNEYTVVRDETGRIGFDVPTTWSEIVEADWIFQGGRVGRMLTVSPDIRAYQRGYAAPGVTFRWSQTLQEEATTRQVLREYAAIHLSRCEIYQRDTLPEGLRFSGNVALFGTCAGVDVGLSISSLLSAEEDFILLIEQQAISTADIEAADHLMRSFSVDLQPVRVLDPREYATVSDETGRISLAVPVAWDETRSAPIEAEGSQSGLEFEVTPDLEEYAARWNATGLNLLVLDGVDYLDPDDFLDETGLEAKCEPDTRDEIKSNAFLGKYNLWRDCAGSTGTYLVTAVLNPWEDLGFAVIVDISFSSEAERAKLEPMLRSLRVTPLGSASSGASVTVLVDLLNIRSGPGTGHEIVGQAAGGERLRVTGQVEACDWLLVESAAGVSGWISGSAQFGQISVECSTIPAAVP